MPLHALLRRVGICKMVICKMEACKMATTSRHGSLSLVRCPLNLSHNIYHSKFGQIEDHILGHNVWILAGHRDRSTAREYLRNNGTTLVPVQHIAQR
jgi:hypothetical protein